MIIKRIAKFILRSNERRKFFREKTIRTIQDKALVSSYDVGVKKLVVFFIDGAELNSGNENISGGLLSIHSIFQETKNLCETHGAEVLLCTMKGVNLFAKFSSFESDVIVFRYEQLPVFFKDVQDILIHIPEYLVPRFNQQSENGDLKYLNCIKHVHVNILNQNIQLMPTVLEVNKIKAYVHKVTQTTAHSRYATRENRNKFNIPLHHLSTFIAQERYNFIPISKKRDKIAISPDCPIKNEKIKMILQRDLPHYEVEIIHGLTYEQFKRYIEEVKFTFTFGEGLDGYYCETVLTGGICFAVYNDEFFTQEYSSLPVVFSSFDRSLVVKGFALAKS